MSPPPEALLALVDDLRSPDPVVRDTGAFTSLAALAVEGRLDQHLVELGVQGMALLRDEEVQARTFGALLLALLADRDNVTGTATDAAVHAWLASLVGWYAEEPDTRGWDSHLGWLHAVAHGADAIGELAMSPRLGRTMLMELLHLLVSRTIAPTTEHWVQDEDDRVAVAAMSVLSRNLLLVADVTPEIQRLGDTWRTAPSGPIPAQVDNAVRLARTLHLQLTLGVRVSPEAEVIHPAVRDVALHELGGALADLHWFYGRPS
ncbi:MAG TPA: DUF2785 domain-containing protein [Actinomycetes bacterium]|nr:DUF2785 domain-containing protein [Actinomycetes bacterium]